MTYSNKISFSIASYTYCLVTRNPKPWSLSYTSKPISLLFLLYKNKNHVSLQRNYVQQLHHSAQDTRQDKCVAQATSYASLPCAT